ncbi:hypothetical protein QQF64_012316 [Cirrhinus molitorella]|uniref:Uncharacterized protein n=1 Tax=Cirrhinus molitorella TaxID=172907 RepID=A0ABR3LXI4_9TELE
MSASPFTTSVPRPLTCRTAQCEYQGRGQGRRFSGGERRAGTEGFGGAIVSRALMANDPVCGSRRVGKTDRRSGDVIRISMLLSVATGTAAASQLCRAKDMEMPPGNEVRTDYTSRPERNRASFF